LKAVLALQSLRYAPSLHTPLLSSAAHAADTRRSYTPKLVDEQRLRDCVDLLLTMQNPDGGFASYELVRGNKRLEWLNTAEVFGESAHSRFLV
jgi:squalene cyclase